MSEQQTSPAGGVVEANRQEPEVPASSAACRIAAFLLAGVLLGLLLVSSQLQPDSRGLGTHQQLGLPPCSMRMMFGMRCPGCGMTTSWAYFTHGHWWQSIQSNVGGFLLAWLSLAVAGGAVWSGIRGRNPSVRAQQALAVAMVAIAVVTMADWAMRVLGIVG